MLYDCVELAESMRPIRTKSILEQKELTLLSMMLFGMSALEDQCSKMALANVAVNRWKEKFKGLSTIREQLLFPNQFDCFNINSDKYHEVGMAGWKSDTDLGIWISCFSVAYNVYFSLIEDNTRGAIYFFHTDKKFNGALMTNERVMTFQHGKFIFLKDEKDISSSIFA